MNFNIQVATDEHLKYVPEILTTIENAAKDRGTVTGIAVIFMLTPARHTFFATAGLELRQTR